ncbi:DUF4873 domain-containing protein [Actinoplanes xinjiangensis]|uniref:DUF4873 domain-containing protein n=1 Tax=Actinoplanes xinjiangensis TaxID=512350 RepID=UPI0034403D2B
MSTGPSNVDSINVDPLNIDAVDAVNGFDQVDEEYRGPATLRLDDGTVPVEIRMSARFEPIEGRFRWAGRTGRHDMLRERVGAGLRKATIVVPGSPETAVKLSDPDPWGGIRLSGTGTPPWFPPTKQPTAERATATEQATATERATAANQTTATEQTTATKQAAEAARTATAEAERATNGETSHV